MSVWKCRSIGWLLLQHHHEDFPEHSLSPEQQPLPITLYPFTLSYCLHSAWHYRLCCAHPVSSLEHRLHEERVNSFFPTLYSRYLNIAWFALVEWVNELPAVVKSMNSGICLQILALPLNCVWSWATYLPWWPSIFSSVKWKNDEIRKYIEKCSAQCLPSSQCWT